MKSSRFRIALALSTVLVVTACAQKQTPPVSDGASSASASSAAARIATVEGMLQKAGVSIFMEGSHRLQMDDGTFLLLKSSMLRLDEYVDQRVIVTGSVQPTVEAGGMIMDVESVVEADVMEPEVLQEEALLMPSSAAVSSSVLARVASSISPIVVAPPVITASSSPASIPPVAARSSSPAAEANPTPSSSPAAGVDTAATVTAMARVAADTVAYSTRYCTGHIGFCMPLHKYWFYQSFGANVSPYLWHVEVSSSEITEVGQGVIIVNLAAGALSEPEGVAIDQGDFVVVSRQWTGNRHFEVSGPKELRAAVEFMANGIEVYAPGA